MANRRKACRIPRSISFAVGNWFTPFDRTIQVTNVNVQCYVRGIGRRPPLPPPPPCYRLLPSSRTPCKIVKRSLDPTVGPRHRNLKLQDRPVNRASGEGGKRISYWGVLMLFDLNFDLKKRFLVDALTGLD